jgi:hypothetical protein
MSRHQAWELFELLVGRLASGPGQLTATGLASLLLDRSCPRPPSLAVARQWWEEALEAILAGRVIPEAVWNSEEILVEQWGEAEARRCFAAALRDLPAGGPQAGQDAEDRRRREDFVMGHVMPELRGRIPGRTVRQWVKEELA